MRILMVQSKYLGEVDAKLRYEIRTHFILSKKNYTARHVVKRLQSQ